MRRRRRHAPDTAGAAVAIALAVGVLGASARGAATEATVVLLGPASPTEVTAEATVRLRGELAAGGFDVAVAELAAGDNVRAALKRAAGREGVVAAVAIVAGPSPEATELWVIDRVTGKTTVRRLTSELQAAGARAAEVLAIRALELLRASSAEVALGARERRAPPPPPPSAAPAPAEAEGAAEAAPGEQAQRLWAFEAGGSVLGSLEGIGPSFAPMARVEIALGSRYLGRLTLAGLGTEAHVSTPAGVADVAQHMALLELGARFRAGARLQPFVSAGAGLLMVMADGRTTWPYEGKSSRLWAMALDAGAGVRIALGGRFELGTELHLLAAQPYPVIRFVDVELARAGRPTLVGSVTLVAWM